MARDFGTYDSSPTRDIGISGPSLNNTGTGTPTNMAIGPMNLGALIQLLMNQSSAQPAMGTGTAPAPAFQGSSPTNLMSLIQGLLKSPGFGPTAPTLGAPATTPGSFQGSSPTNLANLISGLLNSPGFKR